MRLFSEYQSQFRFVKRSSGFGLFVYLFTCRHVQGSQGKCALKEHCSESCRNFEGK